MAIPTGEPRLAGCPRVYSPSQFVLDLCIISGQTKIFHILFNTSHHVQNSAAQLVFKLGPKEHVTPSLLQLHWLPVRWRVQFKICCLMHLIHRGNSPEYLKNIVRSVAASRRHPGHFQPTTCCRAYGPSSASVLSHTPVRLHGTYCLKTSVPHQTLQFLEISLRLIILA